MPTDDDRVPDAPATWENVVVGKAEELLGRVLHNRELTDEGKNEVEAAHKARREYEDEHRD